MRIIIHVQHEYVQNIENKPENWIYFLWYPPGLYIAIYKWAKYTMSKTVTICRWNKYTMSKTVMIYRRDRYAVSKTMTIYEWGKYATSKTMTVWMRAWGLSMKPVVIWGIIDPSLRHIWFRRISALQLQLSESISTISMEYLIQRQRW